MGGLNCGTSVAVTVIHSSITPPSVSARMFDSAVGEDPARPRMENYQFISGVCLSPVTRLFPERAAYFLSSPSSV